MMQADLLLVLHDVSNKWIRSSLSPKILRLLYLYPDKKSILVLNKVDKVKEKRLLLKLSSQLTEGTVGGKAIVTTAARGKTTQSKKPITLEDLSATTASRPIATESTVDSHQPQVANKLTESQVAKMIQGKIGWPHFSQVFLVSALDGDGISEISVVPFPIFKIFSNSPLTLWRFFRIICSSLPVPVNGCTTLPL